jgi:hypothetical protein
VLVSGVNIGVAFQAVLIMSAYTLIHIIPVFM